MCLNDSSNLQFCINQPSLLDWDNLRSYTDCLPMVVDVSRLLLHLESLHVGLQDDVNEGLGEVEQEPDVDHLDICSLGQVVADADEHGCEDKHHCNIQWYHSLKWIKNQKEILQKKILLHFWNEKTWNLVSTSSLEAFQFRIFVFFLQRLSYNEGHLSSKAVFHQRLYRTRLPSKSHLPSKVVFHQRLSSIIGRLSSEVIFH